MPKRIFKFTLESGGTVAITATTIIAALRQVPDELASTVVSAKSKPVSGCSNDCGDCRHA